jgi:hypothetical protein
MDYKGYNIAVHELGHNVEQVLSLERIDHTLLAGVPNNAFTEALAFVFQGRDLELLGSPSTTTRRRARRARHVLGHVRDRRRLAGGRRRLALDVREPDATPAELRDATVRIAQDTGTATTRPCSDSRTRRSSASTRT